MSLHRTDRWSWLLAFGVDGHEDEKNNDSWHFFFNRSGGVRGVLAVSREERFGIRAIYSGRSLSLSFSLL